MRPARTRLWAGLAIATAGALVLTGCGTTSSGSASSGTSGSAQSSAGGSIGPIQVPQLTDPYSQQIAAAAGTTVDTTKFKKDAPYKLATITQGPINGWGTIFDITLKQALIDSGKVDMSKLLYAAWNGKTENQTNAMNDAIAAHVDGIILTSLSRAGLSASVDRAAAAGIPVVTCMAGVDSNNYTAELSRDIPAMGYATAKALAEKLGGKGNVVMLNGIAGVDAAEYWKSGAKAAFAEYPNIKIVSEQYGNWSVGDATNVMRTVVAQQPKIDGVWVGGLEMGAGVINAFQEAGRPVPYISGTDPVNGFLRLAKEQKLDFYVAPFPPGTAKECVSLMLDILAGKSVKKFNDVENLLDGTAPYGTAELDKWYVPGLNDDFIGPLVYPESFYANAGFKRK